MIRVVYKSFKNPEFIQSKKKRGTEQVLKIILDVVMTQKNNWVLFSESWGCDRTPKTIEI